LTLASDTGTSSSDGITNAATVNVTGLETGATWQYSVDGTSSWTTGTGTSFNASSGTHTYSVEQTDVAGNTSLASSALTVTFDNTAPAAPTLALASDTGSSHSDGITNVATINVSGLEAATGTTWQYSSDAGSTWFTGTGSSFSLSDGTYAANSIEVKQTDTAGNTGSAGLLSTAITIDTTAAAPTLALASDTGSSSTDGITNVATVNVTGLETGATWQYSVDGSGYQAGAGSSFSASTGLHTYTIKQTDVAGNTSVASSALTVTLDTTAPSTPTLALASDTGTSSSDGITSVATVNVTGLETGAT
jgi:hypothetical protein